MTVSLMSASLSTSISAWLNQSCKGAPLSVPSRQKSRELLQEQGFECDLSDGFLEFDQKGLWQKMLEAMPQGILVISGALELLYCSTKAENLCEQLRESQASSEKLPSLIIELCERFLEKRLAGVSLVMEAQGQTGGVIRSRVQWMNFSPDATPILLVLMEDCQETVLEGRILEQKKYDLTDREAEVWGLLCQHYTYQDISEALKISMNTVKTHAKNVYAKRKNLVNQRKIWYWR